MTIFVVLANAPTPFFDDAVQNAFASDSKKLGAGQWLVSATGITTKEVTERLEAAAGEKGQVLVASVQNVWGWHQSDVWEWLRAKSVN